MTTERKGIDGYPRDVRIRRNPSSRVHSYTRTLASLFLYIKARSGREGRGESPDGCRRWYPHPGENPSARNGGWLGAVVTLSSTGDAACGLHKQRLRHTHARAYTEKERGRVGLDVSSASATLTNNGEHLVVSRHLSRWRARGYTRL